MFFSTQPTPAPHGRLSSQCTVTVPWPPSLPVRGQASVEDPRLLLSLCAWVCLCECVCVSLCVWTWVSVSLCVWTWVCEHVSVCVSACVCVSWRRTLESPVPTVRPDGRDVVGVVSVHSGLEGRLLVVPFVLFPFVWSHTARVLHPFTGGVVFRWCFYRPGETIGTESSWVVMSYVRS